MSSVGGLLFKKVEVFLLFVNLIVGTFAKTYKVHAFPC